MAGKRKMKDKYATMIRVILVIAVVAILAAWAVPTALKDMRKDSQNNSTVTTETTKETQKAVATEPATAKSSETQKAAPTESATTKSSETQKAAPTESATTKTSETQEAVPTESVTTKSSETQKVVPTEPASTETQKTSETANVEEVKSDEITIWLDSWVWLPIAAANGGNETTPDSKFGERGLTVHIVNNESDEEKAEAFKNGQINAMAATVNRLSLLTGEFYGNTEYVVPYLMDHSSGGDGIVARKNFVTIESLKDARIAVGEGSVSQVMLIYLLRISNLSDDEFRATLNNIVTYSSSEEAANAYLAGEVDAVATWQPFLSQCAAMEDSSLLFSTASSSTLISDAFILNKDFVTENPETVKMLIDGMLEVVEDLKNGENKAEYYDIFRETFPEFAESSDDELDVMFFDEAQLMDWHENMEAFESGTVVDIFKQMCEVWSVIGAETVPYVASNVFDNSFLISLSSKYKDTPERVVEKEVKVDKERLEDYNALITKSVTVTFMPYSTQFVDEEAGRQQIEEFVKVAKVLDGAVIRIEGNVSSHTDSEELRTLSLNRAEAVKKIMVEYGINSKIMFCYGNGASKQKYADPQTDREYELNRSVDIMFVTDEEVFTG